VTSPPTDLCRNITYNSTTGIVTIKMSPLKMLEIDNFRFLYTSLRLLQFRSSPSNSSKAKPLMTVEAKLFTGRMPFLLPNSSARELKGNMMSIGNNF